MYKLSPPTGSMCCLCDTWKFVFFCNGVPFWAALCGLFITILNVYLGYCAEVWVCVYACFSGCYGPQLVDSRQTSLVKTKQDVHFVCSSTLIDIDLFAPLAGLKVCFVPSPVIFPPPRKGSQSVPFSAAFLFLKPNPLSIPSSLKHHSNCAGRWMPVTSAKHNHTLKYLKVLLSSLCVLIGNTGRLVGNK